MADNYLKIAQTILERTQKPMSAREIYRYARSHSYLPGHLYGKTPHKTLHARLAEDLLHNADRSPFYRTGPGYFYLRKFLHDPETPDEYKSVYRAPRRQKTLKNENVLVVPRLLIDDLSISGFSFRYNEVLGAFKSHYSEYVGRRYAENNLHLKQLVSYVIVESRGKYLSYYRGGFSNVNSDLRGKRSLGFGGHVTDDDFDLISSDPVGAITSACREVSEELGLTQLRYDASMLDRFKLIGVVNDDSIEEGKKHIGLVIQFSLRPGDHWKKGELSINAPQFLSVAEAKHSRADFELWSQRILDVDFGQTKGTALS